MSDYLTNLAAKNLNQAELVQPRLRARFEPPREGTWPVFKDSAPLETMAEEANSDIVSPDPSGPARPNHAQPLPPGTAPARLPDRFSPPSGQLITPAPSQSQAAPPPVAPDFSAMRAELPARSLLSEPNRPPIVPASVQSAPDYPPRPATPDLNRDRPVVTPTVGGAFSQVLTPAVVVARPPLRRDNQAAPPVTAEPAAAAPTINVTIGRIEVRATPPAAPLSRPQRSTPPVMPLDEYLRRRSGGGQK